jgi:O-antigen ligase
VCFVVGLGNAALFHVLDEMRPSWLNVSRHRARQATLVAVVVAVVAALAIDLPGRASNGWDEFKEGGGPGAGTGRLGSVAGQSRYQFWSAAVDQNATKPLIGTGSGTFELWWAREGTTDETVRDAHSLYLQTLGELGVIGLALLVAFLASVLTVGGVAVARAGPDLRPALAAALAGCFAFCLCALVDWSWQLPVLVAALLFLASPLLTAGQSSGGERSAIAIPLRLGTAVTAIAAIVAIAIPLASTSLLRESESDVRAGRLDEALEAARSAGNVQPGAASPRLQEALVLEQMGALGQAAGAAGAATEREPTNWKNWLVRSRIEAARGRAEAAVRYFREAESLNPNFSLFNR